VARPQAAHIVAAAGFTHLDLESHGYIETNAATYTPTIVDFGATALADDGLLGESGLCVTKNDVRTSYVVPQKPGEQRRMPVTSRVRADTPARRQRAWRLPRRAFWGVRSGTHRR
jgi:hypothetical protein